MPFVVKTFHIDYIVIPLWLSIYLMWILPFVHNKKSGDEISASIA